MEYSGLGGGWMGGWTFNTTNISLGGYSINTHDNNTWAPLKVLIVSENSHGFTIMTGHHKGGQYFIGNMSALFNSSLGA